MASTLAALPPVERLSPRCIRILGGNPGKFTLQGTNTYLLGTGRRRLLIDTGEGRRAWIDSLRDTLQKEEASIEAAIITHWHGDHTGGIPDLLGLDRNIKIYKNSPSIDQLDISTGQQFSVEGASLIGLHTPGHTSDHFVFVLDEEDAMFTADSVLGHGTAVFEDLAAYLRSLNQMKNMFKGRAYPGHGPVIEDGPARIAEYIAHRAQRESQVLQIMSTTRPGAAEEVGASEDPAGWSAMEIVKVVYVDVPETLHLAACGGVLQILEKLCGEGRVSSHEDRWKLCEDRGASL